MVRTANPTWLTKPYFIPNEKLSFVLDSTFSSEYNHEVTAGRRTSYLLETPKMCNAMRYAAISTFLLISMHVQAGELPSGPPVEVIQGTPPGYEVVRLTAPNDFAIHSFADINDRSDVIWSASFPPDISNIHIFRDGRFYQLTGNEAYDVRPTMNNNGDYTFLRGQFATDDDDIVLVLGGEEIIIDADDAGSAPVVGENGQVVFSDDFSDNFTHVELFLYDGRTTTQITDNGLSNQTARLNNIGDLVWSAKDTTQSPWSADIMYRGFRGVTQSLTTTLNARSAPDINDCREIVWYESGIGVMLWKDGVAAPLTSQNERAPRINDSGELVYLRWDNQAELWRVVVRFVDTEHILGDEIYTFGVGHMNNRGEVAWLGLHDTLGWTALFMMRRTAPKGDANGDCRIDFLDFAMLQHCFTGPDNGPSVGFLADCTRADFDEDGDVDMADLTLFNTAFTGPDALVPDCLP